jgi:UDP-N-acetylmuramyl pentapeptide phosphotransferase/UDP-N-acetylglucosamine-1-phosphate transferase
LWLFIFDTIFTLCRRAARREKIWLPHRAHIYQQLVIRGFSHRAVTILYGSLSAIIGFFVVLVLLNQVYKPALLTVAVLSSILLILLPVWFSGNTGEPK